MGHKLFNSCVIVFLCALFDYAEVAWVFDPCAEHDEHLSHAASESQHDADPSSNPDTSDESLPRLHCTPDAQLFGSATLEDSAQIAAVTEGIPLDTSSAFFVTDGSHARNNLWLNALFKRTLTLSHHSDQPYRLFLSILQI